MKVTLVLLNSADPDEMQQDVAFHLGLYCWPNYPFRVPRIERAKRYL